MESGRGRVGETMDEKTVRSVLDDAVGRLADAGVDDPRRSAEWLLCEVLGTNRAGLYASLSSPVQGERASDFERMLRRRLRHEPLQYILGYTEFFGLRLDVTPDVLIPRPETEELVELALVCLEGRVHPRVLDVGTGSGCIALAVKKARPDAAVYACDVSSSALLVARRNADVNELSVDFREADVLHPGFVDRVPRALDLLVSNPPYVTREEAATLSEAVRSFEPHLALFAGDDPVVFYRHLARHGRRLLEDGGWMVLETHADYGELVADLLEEAGGYEAVELRQDLAGRDRMVRAMRRKRARS